MLTKKNILIIGTIIAILIGWYGWNEYNRPVKGLENVTTEMTISATEIINAYEENEEAANAKYLDKIIEVTGTISSIENEEGVTIHIESNNPMSEVICKLNNDISKINAQPGDNIKIKGHCTGYLMDVLLVNGLIIE